MTHGFRFLHLKIMSILVHSRSFVLGLALSANANFSFFRMDGRTGCVLWVCGSRPLLVLQAVFEASPWEITLEEMSLLLIRDLLVSYLTHVVRI